MHHFEQVVLFPGLERGRGIVLLAQLAHFVGDVRGGNVFVVFAGEGQIEPAGGAFLERVTQPGGKAQGAQQAHRLIGKAVHGEDADLAPLDVRQPVGGVEQKAAGGGIQREGDGVDGKIAPPQVVQDGGETDLGLRAGMLIDFVAGRSQRAVHLAVEDQFHAAQVFVLTQDAGAAFLQFARHAQRIPFHDKIQIADAHPAHQVAHRSAGEVHVGFMAVRQFQHPHHHRALLRSEPAFEQIHIVRHTPSCFLSPGCFR